MKKLFFLLCFVFFASQVYSQVFEENFDYPAPDSVTKHGWIVGSAGINPVLVTTPGLSYTGYQKSDIGNKTTLQASGQDVIKDWTSNISSGRVSGSFMVLGVSSSGAGE